MSQESRNEVKFGIIIMKLIIKRSVNTASKHLFIMDIWCWCLCFFFRCSSDISHVMTRDYDRSARRAMRECLCNT
jgi:hypothetical protein